VRLVIVDGMNNHDWPRANRSPKDILEGSGRFKVEFTTSPTDNSPKEAWEKWRPDFAKCDVVLSNFNDGQLFAAILDRIGRLAM
jgi:uncharacterized protein